MFSLTTVLGISYSKYKKKEQEEQAFGCNEALIEKDRSKRKIIM